MDGQTKPLGCQEDQEVVLWREEGRSRVSSPSLLLRRLIGTPTASASTPPTTGTARAPAQAAPELGTGVPEGETQTAALEIPSHLVEWTTGREDQGHMERDITVCDTSLL